MSNEQQRKRRIDRAFKAIKYGDLNKLRGMDLRPIINEKKDDWTMLCSACSKGDFEIVELLLNVDGIDVNLKSDIVGATPLSIASLEGHLEIVKLLLSVDEIDVNLKTSGHTPLSFACEEGHLEIMKLLLACNDIQMSQYQQEIAQLKSDLEKKQQQIVKYEETTTTLQSELNQIREEQLYQQQKGSDIDSIMQSLKEEITNDETSNNTIPSDIRIKRNIDRKEKRLNEVQQQLYTLLNQQPNGCHDLNSRVKILTDERDQLREELREEYENYENSLNKISTISKKRKLVELYEATKDEITEEEKIITESKESLDIKSQLLDDIVAKKEDIDKTLNQFQDLQNEIETCEEDLEEINFRLNKKKKVEMTEIEKKQFMEKKEKLTFDLSNLNFKKEQLKAQLLSNRSEYPEVILELEQLLLSNSENDNDNMSLKLKFQKWAFSKNLLLLGLTFGHYNQIKLLHRGLSTVHLMERDNQHVVLKEIALDEESYNLIITEITNILRLHSHDRIVKVNGVFINSELSKVYIEMPYYSNGNLRDYIISERHNHSLQVLDRREKMRRIMRSIVETIYYMHSKDVIHRDLKSDNILVDKNGNAVIADFGSSKKLHALLTNRHTRGVGTMLYMAPEVLNMSQAPNEKSDIWSLGVTMLECWYYLENRECQLSPTCIIQYSGENKVHLPTPEEDDEHGKLLMEMLNLIFNCEESHQRPSAMELLNENYFTKGLTEMLEHQGIQFSTPESRIQQWIRVLKDLRKIMKNEINNSVLRLTIDRSLLLEQVTSKLYSTFFNAEQLPMKIDQYVKLYTPFLVKYENESGIDQGALTNELFTQFFNHCLKNDKLFERSETQSVENYILSKGENISSDEEQALVIFGFLLKKVFLECDEKSVYLPINDFILKYLIYDASVSNDVTMDEIHRERELMIVTCQLKKPLKDQISYWKHFVSQYDSQCCENILEMKRYNSNEELQMIEESFSNDLFYSPNSQSIEKKEMAVNMEHVDEYIIHSLREKLFSPIQRRKLKLISKGFQWYSIQQLRNVVSNSSQQQVKSLLTQNKDWFMESKLTVMELKLLLNGQSYIDASMLLNEMDFSQLSPKIRNNFTQVILILNVSELRQLLIWMTSLSSIPLMGLPKKIVLKESDKFASHACITVLHFEVLNEEDYEKFSSQFLNMLKWSVEATQEDR